MRFLRHDPYAYYVCRAKGCTCKKLDWQFGARGAACTGCGHSPMQHGAHFNQQILNPIAKCGYAGAGAQAMLKLRAEVRGQRSNKPSRLFSLWRLLSLLQFLSSF